MTTNWSLVNENEELRSKVSYLKEEYSHLKTDREDAENAFQDVLSRLKEANQILTELYKNEEVSKLGRIRLKKVLTNHQY